MSSREIANSVKEKMKFLYRFVFLKYTKNECLEAIGLVNRFDFVKNDVLINKKLIRDNIGKITIKRITWFIPGVSNPHGGGINTILRFASYFKEMKNVNNCFVVPGNNSKNQIKEKIASAFPNLSDTEIFSLTNEEDLSTINESDISICTLWTTAFDCLKFNRVKRKFYFLNDYEPLFYPAGSISALVEESYRFGFFGISNSITLKKIYEEYYGGKAGFFTPSVDINVFYPDLSKKNPKKFTVFFYGRPGQPRNGFEMGIAALKKLKEEMGDRVQIVTAGDTWNPREFGLEGIIENLGVLDYAKTADIYRNCDLGLVMTFTRNPSYLNLELMACGCLLVTNFNPGTAWLLRDKENCLLSPASASAIYSTMWEGLMNNDQRKMIVETAIRDIAVNYSKWDNQIEQIFQYMCEPDST